MATLQYCAALEHRALKAEATGVLLPQQLSLHARLADSDLRCNQTGARKAMLFPAPMHAHIRLPYVYPPANFISVME